MPDLVLSSVRDLKSLENATGRAFSSVLVIRKLAAKTASNGNPFLSADLGDRSGSFSCTIFNDNPLFEQFKAAGEGGVVRVEGKLDYFQGRLSPRLQKAEVLTEDQLTAPGLIDNLVETAPENPEAMWLEFQGFMERIGHEGLRQTVRLAFEEIGDSFRWSPAAVSMHHAY